MALPLVGSGFDAEAGFEELRGTDAAREPVGASTGELGTTGAISFLSVKSLSFSLLLPSSITSSNLSLITSLDNSAFSVVDLSIPTVELSCTTLSVIRGRLELFEPSDELNVCVVAGLVDLRNGSLGFEEALCCDPNRLGLGVESFCS